jgi:hypothetical protein
MIPPRGLVGTAFRFLSSLLFPLSSLLSPLLFFLFFIKIVENYCIIPDYLLDLRSEILKHIPDT